MSDMLSSLRAQLADAEANLRLIQERKAKYVLSTDVPLSLLKEERATKDRITELQQRLAALRATACPYRGLHAFEAEHQHLFFGRAATTAALVQHVAQHPFTAVVGPSGSGKSSLVRAGLQYTAQQQQARVGLITPDRDPLRRLAARLVDWLTPDLSEIDRLAETRKLLAHFNDDTLGMGEVLARIHERQPHRPLLLIVDQFEELYTQGIAPDVQARYLSLLLAIGEYDRADSQASTRLVLALRADFYDHVLRDRALGAAVSAGQFNVLPLSQDELRAAIAQPAEAVGRHFQPGLVERIVTDVAGEPGNLPLLQFALTQVWERQTAAGALTHAAYDELGGVEQALATYAEQVYARLSADEQAQAQRILVQLVQPGEGTTDTRRIASQSELGDEVWPLVVKLADERLLVTSAPTEHAAPAADADTAAEVTHEALIRGWDRLRGWMNEARRFRVWQERLRIFRRQWEQKGRDAGALLRGAPLAEAEGWLAERATDLSDAEQAYIAASVAQRDAEAAAREAARKRQLRLFQVFTAVLGVLLVLAWDASRFASDQQYAAMQEANARATAEANAEARAREAEQQSALALARQLAAQSVSFQESDPRRALLLAMQSDTVATTLESRSSLLSWLQSSSRLDTTFYGHMSTVWSVAFSPDGQTLASGSEDGNIILWDIATGQPLRVHKEITSSTFCWLPVD